MTGQNLAAVLIAAFFAGAYLALVVRAWFAERAHRRVVDAANAELDLEDFDRLRAYIDRIDRREREQSAHGSTTVYFPRYPQR